MRAFASIPQSHLSSETHEKYEDQPKIPGWLMLVVVGVIAVAVIMTVAGKNKRGE